MDHIGFCVTDKADVETWEQRLGTLNVVHSPTEETANGSALAFRDPDNIQLEFWWNRKH